MHDYDRRTKTAWADPRTRINGADPDRFLKATAREAADISQALKTEFVGLNDLGMQLKTERDEKRLVYWSERIVKGARVCLENSKRAHDLWDTLVKADVTFKG